MNINNSINKWSTEQTVLLREEMYMDNKYFKKTCLYPQPPEKQIGNDNQIPSYSCKNVTVNTGEDVVERKTLFMSM